MKIIVVILFVAFLLNASAQNNVGIGTITPNASALLDITSTNKGLLVPRMTAVQRQAINPATNARALMVFDTDSSAFFFWTGAVWSKLGSGSGGSQWVNNGNNIYNSNSGNVGIGITNPQYKLNVNGRIGIKALPNQLGGTAGIWFGKENENGSGAFVGNENDSIVGFYGDDGAGWSFRMNMKNGKIGIADANPTAKLSINGNIKIADGTESNGRVLTSDANGLASWQALPVTTNTWATSGNNIYNINAGFVGIGNTNPSYKFDLSGRMRIRGGIDNNFTAGMWLGGVGADSATNKMFFGMESDSTVGFYTEQNFSGWFLVANGKNGRLGIRNRDPKYPLSFDNQVGDKISLYQETNGTYYGMGIGSSTMQLVTPNINSSVVFGYGSSDSYTENMRVGGNGNVSIGTAVNSLAGLTVNKKVGAANAIFGSNTTGVAIESAFPGIGFNNYFDGSRKTIATGFSAYIGVNPSSGGMQFLVSGASANTGSTPAFNTGIFITPAGNTGIGITDPAYKLDVGDRMRIRATPGFTAGVWLNNETNTAIPAFIGMQADNQVGFFGSGSAGWGLLMNTQTGAVSFGGNAGQPGQVLTSNGTNGAPVWQSPNNGTLYQAAQTAYLTNSVTDVRRDIPGLVANFTLVSPSRVLFQFVGNVYTEYCLACGQKKATLTLLQNIVGGSTEIISSTGYVPNNDRLTISSGPVVVDLAAGNYTYKVMLGGTGSILSNVGDARLTWQIFPN